MVTSRTMWQVFLFLMVTIDTLGNALAGYWQLHSHKMIYAVLALLCFLLANVALLYMLKNGSGLGRAVVSFGVLSSLAGLCVSVFIYHESYTWTQVLGLGLGVVTILLLR